MAESWITLFRAAISHDAAKPLVVALATVDAEGNPQVRSVICRRFDNDGSLWFTSDARSAKNAELAQHPVAAAVCWLAESRQQFRFIGPVTICDDEPERLRLWSELKPETRATFTWPAPGAPRELVSTFAAAFDSPVPPPAFSVLRLTPTTVEHLHLATHPHLRRQWRLADGWLYQDLNP